MAEIVCPKCEKPFGHLGDGRLPVLDGEPVLEEELPIFAMD